MGSPPQVRGKQSPDFGGFRAARITPAGAGKTIDSLSVRAHDEDHPRRCGENAVPQPVYTIKPGSPPQVRGKRLHCVPDVLRDADHPRRCGENGIRQPRLGGCGGSPPQVRGKLECEYYDTHTPGITPAGAGKTRRNPAPAA